MVVLNRIYTRTGDDGTTALGSGERRPKYDLRVAAYGTVDETNAAIGIARLHLRGEREVDAILGRVQNDLFDLGADLAVPEKPDAKRERLRISDGQVDASREPRSTGSTRSCGRSARSSCLAARRPPRTCISPAPCAGAPSGWSSSSPRRRARPSARRRSDT